MSRLFRAGLVIAATLPGSARAVTAPPLSVPLKAVDAAGSGASGMLTIRTLSPTSSVSVLTVRGLTPNTAYVAHYHALGTASSTPCLSNGPVTLGFPAFRTDAQGQASVLLRTDPARISGTQGAYVHVHPSANPAAAPLCGQVLKVESVPPTARPASPAALQATVKIGDNFFLPTALTVAAGTTVTWTHTGRVTHNVLSVSLPGLHSADLHPGESYSYTFNTPGTFTYYCSYHEGMSATISVTNR